MVVYESFYRLTEKPFSIIPDPDFLYWSDMHRMAFAMLKYGLLNQAGFTVITGEIGCGKTTLIRHLLTDMGDRLTVGLLSNVCLNSQSLLNWVMRARPKSDCSRIFRIS